MWRAMLRIDWVDVDLAMRLLGLDEADDLKELDRVAEIDEKHLRWVAFALALGQHEGELEMVSTAWTSSRIRDYFAFLERHGYEISEAEQEMLG